MHPEFEPGMIGSLGPKAGPYGKVLFYLWVWGMLISDAFFFPVWCHQCLGSPPWKVTIPSGAFCLLWSTPSQPETHPGFEPVRPRSPRPTAGADVKALSSVGDEECFSVVLYIFISQEIYLPALKPYLPLRGLCPHFRYH